MFVQTPTSLWLYSFLKILGTYVNINETDCHIYTLKGEVRLRGQRLRLVRVMFVQNGWILTKLVSRV